MNKWISYLKCLCLPCKFFQIKWLISQFLLVYKNLYVAKKFIKWRKKCLILLVAAERNLHREYKNLYVVKKFMKRRKKNLNQNMKKYKNLNVGKKFVKWKKKNLKYYLKNIKNILLGYLNHLLNKNNKIRPNHINHIKPNLILQGLKKNN